MIHQNLKDSYYIFLRPCSLLLRPAYRWHYTRFLGNRRKAHIGCGPNYLSGFVNIDGNFRRRADYTMDVRAGLPFPDNSLDFIYSCHMLEHLHVDEALKLLNECRRVLKPSGYVRLTLPDLNYALRILRGEEKSSFPRSFSCADGQAINFLFCDGQHKYAYTSSLLTEMALGAGFSKAITTSNRDENLQGMTYSEPGGSFSVNLFK